MTQADRHWPSREEYAVAIRDWKHTVYDAELRCSTLYCDAFDNPLCYGGSNLYVCMYRIGDWMVRCICSNPPYAVPSDIVERYQTIARFSQDRQKRVSALVPVTYHEKGITVGERIFPILKMPFLASCPSLGEFVLEHYQEHETMQHLSDAWQCMIHEMEVVPMAHGDLDLSNVLVQVTETNITLKLIDYDNMWLPALAGRAQTEYGHLHFQHPTFMQAQSRPYTAEMDRFAALVIYISLKMLVTHPQLYDAYGANEATQLLLSNDDYAQRDQSGNRLAELRSLATSELRPYIDELIASLHQHRMPRSLDTIVPTRISTVLLTFPEKPPVTDWSDVSYTKDVSPVHAHIMPSKEQPISLSQNHTISQIEHKSYIHAAPPSWYARRIRGIPLIFYILLFVLLLVVFVALLGVGMIHI